MLLRITDLTPLRITGVTVEGKKLSVAGEGFDQGAVIVINNTDLQTQNDMATPSRLLVSKRGAKQIARSNGRHSRAQYGWPGERRLQFHARL